jgi:hypothetical protein
MATRSEVKRWHVILALVCLLPAAIVAIVSSREPSHPPAELSPRTRQILVSLPSAANTTVQIEKGPVSLDARYPDANISPDASADEALLIQSRESLGRSPLPMVQTRTFGVDLYVGRKQWEDIPYPDRPIALKVIAHAWCSRVENSYLNSVAVRDIRNGEELASSRRVTPRIVLGAL